MTCFTLPNMLFLVMAALILGGGAIVAFSRNIVHSGFALLGAFAGVAGMYGLLEANFLAAVQLLVYVGGVLIVILFAVMLTQGIENSKTSNPTNGLIPAAVIGGLIALALIIIALGYPWPLKPPTSMVSTVPVIGSALLGKYLIPFEILSVLLLAALVGAVMLVRKEIKPDQENKEVSE